jgi:tetratricopeptide (TPR) repeat protein
MTHATSAADAAEHYRRGLDALKRGDAREGLLCLKAAVDLDGGRGDYWLAYCEALAACGETATALAVAEGARRGGIADGALDALAARLRPPAAPEFIRLQAMAVAEHRAGRLTQAASLYRQVLALKPDFAEAHVNLGSLLQAQGDVGQAVAHFRHAIALKPDSAAAHYNLGNALALQGDDPAPAYAAAIAAKPGFAQAHYNLALAFEKAGRIEEAAAAYRAAAKAQPDFAEAHANLGVLLSSAGALDEAVAAYDAALAVRPDFAAAHSNRGNALRAKGAHAQAEAAYRSAIAADPDFAEAHNHLGNLLRERGRLEEAVASYLRALEIRPGFDEVLPNLGYALAEQSRIGEGFAILTRHAERICGGAMPDPGPPHKQRHDAEQRAYLGTGLGSGGPDPCGPLRLEGGARLEGPAVNSRNDIAAIERQWATASPQVVVIDDFLSAPALAALRRFCHGSTIWREAYEKGYLGAFPEHGLACPLLAQIAEELKSLCRGIFLDHPLLQLWAFKYESRLSGIPLHADFAAVNVNFWIAPDEANRNPDGGGLVIWDVPAPLDWDFKTYNNDPQAGREFLAGRGARPLTVPHRCNRAVIFDSDLFHETDAVDFAEGYLNRRINLTLLYGRRGR